jgi:ketosteroid isomerase-like protein
MPTPEAVRAAAENYVACSNRNDKEATVACFRPDAVWHDPVGAPPHVGHAGIAEFWDQARSLSDSIQLVPSEIIVCGAEAAMVMEIHVAMGDTTMVMDCVETVEVGEDGLITGMKAYWDMSRARTRA